MGDYDAERQPLKDKGGEGGDGGERVEMKFIQGFRFVAMGWIILFHYIQMGPVEGLWPGNLILGRPLDLFTVISGFVTHLAYGRRERIGGPFQFLLKRSSKLFFMYYSTLLLAWLLHDIAWWVQGVPFVKHVFHFLCNVLPAFFGLNVWFSVIWPFFPDDGQGMPPFLHALAKNCFPVNGALWYIQTLCFCWFSYPLLRKFFFPAPGGSRVQKLAIMFLLWFFAILPAMIADLITDESFHWVFLKVFPPFMLPSFFLGAAACDLYQQEVEEAKSSEKPPGWHELATFFGEIIFLFVVLFVATVTTDDLIRFHLYCLAFAFVVFFLAVASASPAPQTFHLSFKRFLESTAMVTMGDLSLVAYTLQSPLSTLYYWVLGERGIMDRTTWIHVHWMPVPWFLVFFVSLYVLAALINLIDKPVSAKISERLRAALSPSPDSENRSE